MKRPFVVLLALYLTALPASEGVASGCWSDFVGGRILLTEESHPNNPVTQQLAQIKLSGEIGHNQTTFNSVGFRELPKFPFVATVVGDLMLIEVVVGNQVVGKGEFSFGPTYQRLMEDCHNFSPDTTHSLQPSAPVKVYHEIRLPGRLQLDSTLAELFRSPQLGDASLIIYGISNSCFYPDMASSFWFDFTDSSHRPVMAQGTLRYEP